MRGGTGRIVLTVIAVACGVALACAIDLVNRAAYAAFVDIIDTMAGRASLQVSAGRGADSRGETAARIRSVRGVVVAVAVVSSRGPSPPTASS